MSVQPSPLKPVGVRDDELVLLTRAQLSF